MNDYEVKKIDRPVQRRVEVPGSKSITNRALLLSALSEGKTLLEGVLFSDDVHWFLESLKKLGFSVEADREYCRAVVYGEGGKIPKKKADIYVGSAGTAARFLTCMLGLSAGSYRIGASEQMKKRPMKDLLGVLEGLGAEIICTEEEGHLPIQICGIDAGKIESADVDLSIQTSTQYLSALLMMGPMFANGLHIHVTGPKKTGSYVAITRNMMQQFGVMAQFDGSDYTIASGEMYKGVKRYRIEPDMSAACYFYAGAAVTGSRIAVDGVSREMMQGDVRFLQVLEQMGCTLTDEPDGLYLCGPSDGHLHAVQVNMNDFSDQALTLAAIAPYADGPVVIEGIGHIRRQESDRLHAMKQNLTNAGIRCEEREDGITIHPGQPQPCNIETFDDHRVAMSFSLLGLRADGIRIQNPGCCAKTFPEYFEVFDRVFGSASDSDA